MAYYSRVRYTANGSLDTYNVPFPYLSQNHVYVFLDGVVTTDYTWLNATSIKLDSVPTNGTAIFIFRLTPRTTREVNFENTSALTEEILDLDSNQLFYAMQEALDDGQDAVKIDASSNGYDADNNPIINLSTPTNDSDAATKAYVDGLFEGAADDVLQPYVDAAEAWAIGVGEIEPGEYSAKSWTQGAMNAQQACIKWASEAEDVIVVDTRYSALHYAAKAEDFASAASGSSSSASGYASDASDSATLAEQWASEDEDVVVADGKYSAYHWAQKAQEAAEGVSGGGGSGYDIDVKEDYSAAGDGVANDSTAISNALNAASNKTLFFPAGTYLVSSASGITINAIQNARIVFHPNAKLIFDSLTGTASGLNFTPSPTKNTKTTSGTASAGSRTITLSSGSGIVAGDYLQIDTQGTAGIYLILEVATNTLTLDRRLIKDVAGSNTVYHMASASIAKNIEIQGLNCDFIKTGTSNTTNSLVRFSYVDKVLLSGVTMANSEIPSSLLNIYYCKKVEVENLDVNIPYSVDSTSTSCIISGTNSNDIKIDKVSGTNVVDGIAFTGCNDFKINNSILHGQVSSTNDGSTSGMIYLANCSKGVITDCFIDYHYRTGIRLATNYAGIVVRNNTIHNVGYGSGYEEAIDVVGSNTAGEGVVVDGNTIVNCDVQVGIRVASAPQSRIINNSISGLSGTTAIDAGGSTYTICAFNVYDSGDTVSNGNTGSVSDNNIAY